MFELDTITKVTITNVNPRPEFHGEGERVRAVDISFRVDGANDLLDKVEAGLLVHHFTNRAAAAGQDRLPEMLMALPNLRFPKLPTKVRYDAEGRPVRGFRLEIDWGLGDRNAVLEDCVLPPTLWFEGKEGGSASVGWTLQYNGEKLKDDAFYGRICGLGSESTAHIVMNAPVQAIVVKGKLGSWRSGHPETPPPKDGGAPLLEGQQAQHGQAQFEKPDDGTDDDVVHADGSPEAALAGTEHQGEREGPDPDSSEQHDGVEAEHLPPPARRGRKPANRPTAH